MTNGTLNDLWSFSINKKEWTNVNQFGDIPSPRCGHSLHFHGEKLFLFGGLRVLT